MIEYYVGLYRVAQQTQVLQEGHLLPYDHAPLCQHVRTEPLRNTNHFIRFDKKQDEKPTEKCSIPVSVFHGLNRPKPPTFREKTKNRPSHFSKLALNTMLHDEFYYLPFHDRGGVMP